MFDLNITHEVNKLLKDIRKGLRDKGYKESKSRIFYQGKFGI